MLDFHVFNLFQIGSLDNSFVIDSSGYRINPCSMIILHFLVKFSFVIVFKMLLEMELHKQMRVFYLLILFICLVIILTSYKTYPLHFMPRFILGKLLRETIM